VFWKEFGDFETKTHNFKTCFGYSSWIWSLEVKGGRNSF